MNIESEPKLSTESKASTHMLTTDFPSKQSFFSKNKHIDSFTKNK